MPVIHMDLKSTGAGRLAMDYVKQYLMARNLKNNESSRSWVRSDPGTS